MGSAAPISNEKQLINAIKTDDIVTIKSLLSQGTNPNWNDPNDVCNYNDSILENTIESYVYNVSNDN